MSILRKFKKETYTNIWNEIIKDDRLSFDALGMLIYLLSKPDGWTVKAKSIMNERSVGRHKTLRILRELKEAGYLRSASISVDGNFIWMTELYEDYRMNPDFHTNSDDKKSQMPENTSSESENQTPRSENPTSVSENRTTEVWLPDVGLPDVGLPDVGKPDRIVITDLPITDPVTTDQSITDPPTTTIDEPSVLDEDEVVVVDKAGSDDQKNIMNAFDALGVVGPGVAERLIGAFQKKAGRPLAAEDVMAWKRYLDDENERGGHVGIGIAVKALEAGRTPSSDFYDHIDDVDEDFGIIINE